ncbi:MAG: PKD domain-containing protein, partial [Flavobacteriales bacterium]
ATSDTSGIRGLAVTELDTLYFEWNVTNGICDTVKDTVRLIVYPEASSRAGNDRTLCMTDSSTYRLGARSILDNETGTWSVIASPGVGIVSPNDSNSAVTGLTPGTYQFVWAVTNGICLSVADTMEVIMVPEPIVEAGDNDTLCAIGPTTYTLLALPILGTDTGEWTNGIANPTAADFSDSSLFNPTVTNLRFGTYEFIWTVTNGVCDPVSDTVYIQIDSISDAVAGPDASICENLGGTTTHTFQAQALTGTRDTGTWSLLVPDNSIMFSDSNDPLATVSNLVPNDYTFIWTVSNGQCVSEYDTVVISVYEQSQADAGKDTAFCEPMDTYELRAGDNHSKNYHNYTWTYNVALSRSSVIPAIAFDTAVRTSVTGLTVGRHVFTLTVDNGVCNAVTDNVTIEVYAKPIVSFNVNDQVVCIGETSNFVNTSTAIDSSNSFIIGYDWSFGDGSTSNSANPTYQYADEGVYDVSLIAQSDKGCYDTLTETAVISVNPLPVAAFDITPLKSKPGEQTIITDLSIGASTYLYDLGNGFSTDPAPIYNYFDTGTYTVIQYVMNEFGCRDSTSMTVMVQDGQNIYVPNAFTPNGDGDNDFFRPVFLSVDSEKYSFMIFNRWGELLFQTNDVLDAWDGRHNGEEVPIDAYVYRISYKEKNGFGRYTKEGHVNVIR